MTTKNSDLFNFIWYQVYFPQNTYIQKMNKNKLAQGKIEDKKVRLSLAHFYFVILLNKNVKTSN